MPTLRRPLAFCGAVYALALAAAYIAGLTALLLLLAGTVALSLVLYRRGDGRANIPALAAVVLAMGLCVWSVSTMRGARILCAYAGTTQTVSGVVTQARDYSGATLVNAEITAIEGARDRGFETSFFSTDRLYPGDAFTARLTFSGGQNPYSKRLSIQSGAEEILRIERGKNTLYALSAAARGHLTESVRRWLPGEEGDVAVALITGDKGQVPTALSLDFNRAGVSHILVVSGLHITLIIGLVCGLAEKLRAGRVVGLAALGSVIATCIVFYGPTPSVLRACAMGFLSYAGRAFLRRSDPVTSLGAAVLLVLTLDPTAIGDVSFLLSFGCCVALTVVYPRVQRELNARLAGAGFFRRPLRHVANALALTLCVNLVTFPLLVLFGIPVSLVAPLSNVLVVPLVPVLLISAFGMAVPVELLSGLFGLAAGTSAKLIIAVSRFFASFSLAAVGTGDGWIKIFVLYGLAVIAVCLVRKKERVSRRVTALLMALVLCIGILSRFAMTAGTPGVTLYRDGAVIVQNRGIACVVVYDLDAKGADYLASQLRYQYAREIRGLWVAQELGGEGQRRLAELFAGVALSAIPRTGEPAAVLQEPEGGFALTVSQGYTEIKTAGAALRVDFDGRTVSVPDSGAAAVLKNSGASGQAVFEVYLRGERAYYPTDGLLRFYLKESGRVTLVVE